MVKTFYTNYLHKFVHLYDIGKNKNNETNVVYVCVYIFINMGHGLRFFQKVLNQFRFTIFWTNSELILLSLKQKIIIKNQFLSNWRRDRVTNIHPMLPLL